MSKKILTIIVFIALIFLVGRQYFLPAFDRVSELRQELQLWQEKLGNTQALSKKLETLRKKYIGLINESERISQAVPQKEDVPGLLAQLEGLASQNGLILEDVSLALPEVSKTKKKATSANVVTAVSGVKTLTVNLSLAGAHESFKSFLKSIEGNLRIMDVTGITFSSEGSLSGETPLSLTGQEFKVSLNTYFRE